MAFAVEMESFPRAGRMSKVIEREARANVRARVDQVVPLEEDEPDGKMKVAGLQLKCFRKVYAEWAMETR